MTYKWFKHVNCEFIKIHHIYASGYRRFVVIQFYGYGVVYLRISDDLYAYLKNEGIFTAQYLLYHKEDC